MSDESASGRCPVTSGVYQNTSGLCKGDFLSWISAFGACQNIFRQKGSPDYSIKNKIIVKYNVCGIDFQPSLVIILFS